MKRVEVHYLANIPYDQREDVQRLLIGKGAKLDISTLNWADFSHFPPVTLFLGYCGEKLWLHYMVKGDFVKAEFQHDHDPVWQDSCVEFFVAVDSGYMNIEFNALGNCLAAFGEGRGNRERLSVDDMNQIIRWAPFTAENVPNHSLADWQLTVAIPLTLIKLWSGKAFRANFYKCGDHTSIPHFVSWAPIATEKPDFHRPEFFGELELSKR